MHHRCFTRGVRMSINRIFAGVAIAGALLSLPSSLGAQNALKGKLAAAKSVKCTFPLVAVGTWSAKQAEANVKPANLTLQFTSINTDEGTAQLEASVGQYDI